MSKAKLVKFYDKVSIFSVNGERVAGYLAKEDIGPGNYLVRLTTPCVLEDGVEFKPGQLVVLQTKHIQSLHAPGEDRLSK